jgi:hypothetical protein
MAKIAVDGILLHRSFRTLTGADFTTESKARARMWTIIAGPTSTIAMSIAIRLFRAGSEAPTAKVSAVATIRPYLT